MDKCSTCKQNITPDCDYNQGRCPHRPALISGSVRFRTIMAWVILLLCGMNIYLYWSSNDTVYAWIVAFIGWLDVVTHKGK